MPPHGRWQTYPRAFLWLQQLCESWLSPSGWDTVQRGRRPSKPTAQISLLRRSARCLIGLRGVRQDETDIQLLRALANCVGSRWSRSCSGRRSGSGSAGRCRDCRCGGHLGRRGVGRSPLASSGSPARLPRIVVRGRLSSPHRVRGRPPDQVQGGFGPLLRERGDSVVCECDCPALTSASSAGIIAEASQNGIPSSSKSLVGTFRNS